MNRFLDSYICVRYNVCTTLLIKKPDNDTNFFLFFYQRKACRVESRLINLDYLIKWIVSRAIKVMTKLNNLKIPVVVHF